MGKSTISFYEDYNEPSFDINLYSDHSFPVAVALRWDNSLGVTAEEVCNYYMNDLEFTWGAGLNIFYTYEV